MAADFSPSSWRKSSLNTIVRGAEQKLGNQPSAENLASITNPLDTFFDHLKTHILNKTLDQSPYSIFANSLYHLWKKANEIGTDARPFPTVFTALVLLHRTMHSLTIDFSALPQKAQQSWLYAAFLLASKVEETPVGFSPRKMWPRFTVGKTPSEQSDFHRDVLNCESKILVALGFNIVVKLPHIRVLRIESGLGIVDAKIIASALLLSSLATLDATLALADPAAVAAAALQLSDFTSADDWTSQFHLDLQELSIIRARLIAINKWLGLPALQGTSDADPNGHIQQIKITPCSHVSSFTKIVALNKGTYGTVWKAKDNRTSEEVALKLLHGPCSRNDGFRYYVLREMLYLIRLNHPNIINGREVVFDDTDFLADSDRNDIDFYICMELVQYDLLKLMLAQCEQKTRFDQAQVKHLMRQLLLGVEHMHRYALLHRDLKLANVLLTSAGQLKIADLGSIRDTDRTALALTTQVVSLFYRPPELLLLTTHYTETLDVWSIGCLFYELLTYRRLFAGSNELEMIRKMMRVLGAPRPDVWEAVYKNLAGVNSHVLRALSENPNPIPLSTQADLQTTPGITPAAIDLLAKMLDWDPRTRIRASEALAHPYFSEDPEPQIPIPILKQQPLPDDEEDD